MSLSEDSGSRLQSTYRQMVALILLLMVLAILGYKYFEAVPGIVGQSLQVEHTRLINVLAMTKSKWLGEGKPSQMTLDWVRQQDLENPDSDDADVGIARQLQASHLMMSYGGWPVPNEYSSQGCSELWQQLLGGRLDGEELWAEYDEEVAVCRFKAVDGSQLEYRLDSGAVYFLSFD